MTSEIRVRAGRYEVEPHNCFACGQLNAAGLGLVLHVADHRCWTELVLGTRFEGWEGIAHGGILATILDEVMAWALAETDSWGVTARLAVDYRRPVPVDRLVRGEAWVTETRRRVMRTAGRIVDPESGEVYTTAEGVYVAADSARRRALQDRYLFRLVPEGPADTPAPVTAS